MSLIFDWFSNIGFSTIVDWFVDNKLSVNFAEDKTNPILFSPKHTEINRKNRYLLPGRTKQVHAFLLTIGQQRQYQN